MSAFLFKPQQGPPPFKKFRARGRKNNNKNFALLTCDWAFLVYHGFWLIFFEDKLPWFGVCWFCLRRIRNIFNSIPRNKHLTWEIILITCDGDDGGGDDDDGGDCASGKVVRSESRSWRRPGEEWSVWLWYSYFRYHPE